MSRARPPSWTPSRRELRKYASLFLKTDVDRDGYVEAGEAYSLCERSGLDEYVLGQAWQHADRDQDGRLNFHEFVALVHLITCCTRGFECPPAEAGMPSELEAALYALVEMPDELQAQRSRSSSRSGSESPIFPSMRQPVGSSMVLPPGSGEFEESHQGHRHHHGHQESGGSRHEKKKKRHKEHGSSGSPSRLDRHHLPPEAFEEPADGPRFGSQASLDFSQRDPADDVSAVKKHMRAVLEADRIVLRHVQRDVDKVEDELQRVQDRYRQLQQQIRRERVDSDTRLTVQKQLEHQVMDAKSQLEALRKARKAKNVDSVAFWRDRDHYSQELAFLKNTAEEEGMVLDQLRSANDYLDRCQKAYTEQASQLERQRKELADMLAREERLMQRDELQNEEARAQLERMRRETGDSKGITTEEVDLMKHRLRSNSSMSSAGAGAATAMGLSPMPDADSRSVRSMRSGRSAAESSRHSQSEARQSERQPPVTRPSDAHSWASSLIGGTFGLPSGVGSAAEDPRSREGV